VVKPEILSAVRKQGIASLDEVKAVVLETDGSFAIVKASDIEPTALADVSGDEATHEQDCPSVDTQHGQS
ncbi:MAG: YetF domain-containing protein, partial [Thermomicrobiales bacterium]